MQFICVSIGLDDIKKDRYFRPPPAVQDRGDKYAPYFREEDYDYSRMKFFYNLSEAHCLPDTDW